MSVAFVVEVVCDVAECGRSMLSSRSTVPAARKQAREHGWSRKRGKDICAHHAAPDSANGRRAGEISPSFPWPGLPYGMGPIV